MSPRIDITIPHESLWNLLGHMDGQPPARGPDPAHEGLASGPPPYSAITLQSGPRNPSQKNAGFISEMYALTANMFASVANRYANYGDRYYAANQKYI